MRRARQDHDALSWIETENRFTNTLYTGSRALAQGDLVLFLGEHIPRRVTNVSGSHRAGWYAYFRKQGPVPTGSIRWRLDGLGAQVPQFPARPSPRAPLVKDESPLQRLYSITAFGRSPEGRRRWNVMLPCAGVVARHINQAMQLSGRARNARPAESHRHHGQVGTAVDYFLGTQIRQHARYEELPAGIDPARGRAYESILERTSGMPPGLEHLRELRDHLARTALAIPVRRPPSVEQTAALFGLAAFEAVYRAGLPAAAGLAPLRPLVGMTSAQRRRSLRTLYPAAAIRDTRRCCDALLELIPDSPPLDYNPHFNRYGAIGGCDGDLLSGRILYDLKCTNAVEVTFIWQLVGYACLEALGNRGERRMDAVGLINPRFGFVWQMELDALCRAAGGQSFGAVTHEFQRLLARDIK